MLDNAPELRAWVLGVADLIREARGRVAEILQANPPATTCRACGQRP